MAVVVPDMAAAVDMAAAAYRSGTGRSAA